MANQVLVADRFPADETLAVAQTRRARMVQRACVNHATQFNGALTQLDADTGGLLRPDADKYPTPQLALEIGERAAGRGRVPAFATPMIAVATRP